MVFEELANEKFRVKRILFRQLQRSSACNYITCLPLAQTYEEGNGVWWWQQAVRFFGDLKMVKAGRVHENSVCLDHDLDRIYTYTYCYL